MAIDLTLYQMATFAAIGAFIGIMVDNTLITAGLSGYTGSDTLEKLVENKKLLASD